MLSGISTLGVSVLRNMGIGQIQKQKDTDIQAVGTIGLVDVVQILENDEQQVNVAQQISLTKRRGKASKKKCLGEKVFVKSGVHGYHPASIVLTNAQNDGTMISSEAPASHVFILKDGVKHILIEWDSTRCQEFVPISCIDWVNGTPYDDVCGGTKTGPDDHMNEPNGKGTSSNQRRVIDGEAGTRRRSTRSRNSTSKEKTEDINTRSRRRKLRKSPAEVNRQYNKRQTAAVTDDSNVNICDGEAINDAFSFATADDSSTESEGCSDWKSYHQTKKSAQEQGTSTENFSKIMNIDLQRRESSKSLSSKTISTNSSILHEQDIMKFVNKSIDSVLVQKACDNNLETSLCSDTSDPSRHISQQSIETTRELPLPRQALQNDSIYNSSNENDLPSCLSVIQPESIVIPTMKRKRSATNLDSDPFLNEPKNVVSGITSHRNQKYVNQNDKRQSETPKRSDKINESQPSRSPANETQVNLSGKANSNELVIYQEKNPEISLDVAQPEKVPMSNSWHSTDDLKGRWSDKSITQCNELQLQSAVSAGVEKYDWIKFRIPRKSSLSSEESRASKNINNDDISASMVPKLCGESTTTTIIDEVHDSSIASKRGRPPGRKKSTKWGQSLSILPRKNRSGKRRLSVSSSEISDEIDRKRRKRWRQLQENQSSVVDDSCCDYTTNQSNNLIGKTISQRPIHENHTRNFNELKIPRKSRKNALQNTDIVNTMQLDIIASNEMTADVLNPVIYSQNFKNQVDDKANTNNIRLPSTENNFDNKTSMPLPGDCSTSRAFSVVNQIDNSKIDDRLSSKIRLPQIEIPNVANHTVKQLDATKSLGRDNEVLDNKNIKDMSFRNNNAKDGTIFVPTSVESMLDISITRTNNPEQEREPNGQSFHHVKDGSARKSVKTSSIATSYHESKHDSRVPKNAHSSLVQDSNECIISDNENLVLLQNQQQQSNTVHDVFSITTESLLGNASNGTNKFKEKFECKNNERDSKLASLFVNSCVGQRHSELSLHASVVNTANSSHINIPIANSEVQESLNQAQVDFGQVHNENNPSLANAAASEGTDTCPSLTNGAFFPASRSKSNSERNLSIKQNINVDGIDVKVTATFCISSTASDGEDMDISISSNNDGLDSSLKEHQNKDPSHVIEISKHTQCENDYNQQSALDKLTNSSNFLVTVHNDNALITSKEPASVESPAPPLDMLNISKPKSYSVVDNREVVHTDDTVTLHLPVSTQSVTIETNCTNKNLEALPCTNQSLADGVTKVRKNRWGPRINSQKLHQNVSTVNSMSNGKIAICTVPNVVSTTHNETLEKNDSNISESHSEKSIEPHAVSNSKHQSYEAETCVMKRSQQPVSKSCFVHDTNVTKSIDPVDNSNTTSEKMYTPVSCIDDSAKESSDNLEAKDENQSKLSIRIKRKSSKIRFSVRSLGFTVALSPNGNRKVRIEKYCVPRAIRIPSRGDLIYFYCGCSMFYLKKSSPTNLYHYGCHLKLCDGMSTKNTIVYDVIYLTKKEIRLGISNQLYIEVENSDLTSAHLCKSI